MSTSPSSDHASSHGHALSGTDWLDAHFEADRPEYEALLRSVGLRRGWHVLDAGCGAGSFLPLIAAEVGPTGRITALDLAPENIVAVEHRVASWALECPVSTGVGSLLDLPLTDGCLDAVWCANTSQYLSDDELRTALAEFRRVVRPGGIVALKEGNAIFWNFAPGGPSRMWRALEATRGFAPRSTACCGPRNSVAGWKPRGMTRSGNAPCSASAGRRCARQSGSITVKCFAGSGSWRRRPTSPRKIRPFGAACRTSMLPSIR